MGTTPRDVFRAPSATPAPPPPVPRSVPPQGLTTVAVPSSHSICCLPRLEATSGRPPHPPCGGHAVVRVPHHPARRLQAPWPGLLPSWGAWANREEASSSWWGRLSSGLHKPLRTPEPISRRGGRVQGRLPHGEPGRGVRWWWTRPDQAGVPNLMPRKRLDRSPTGLPKGIRREVPRRVAGAGGRDAPGTGLWFPGELERGRMFSLPPPGLRPHPCRFWEPAPSCAARSLRHGAGPGAPLCLLHNSPHCPQGESRATRQQVACVTCSLLAATPWAARSREARCPESIVETGRRREGALREAGC